MVESSEIQQLREDIQELRLLYRQLAETLLPEEEPTPEEKAALDDESREYFSESEFLRMLQGDVRRSSKRSASRTRMAERYVDRVVVCDDGFGGSYGRDRRGLGAVGCGISGTLTEIMNG